MTEYPSPPPPQPGQPFQPGFAPPPAQPLPDPAWPQQPWPQQPWAPQPPPPAKSQVTAPAICLLVLSILGIVNSIAGVAQSLLFKNSMPQVMQEITTMQERMEADMEKQQRKRAEEMGVEYTPRPRPPMREMNDFMGKLMMQGGSFGVVFSLLGVVFSSVSIAGGFSMLSLRHYPLAIAAMVLTMMPGTSPCCLLGLPLGIWGLVVLFRPEVRAAFQ